MQGIDRQQVEERIMIDILGRERNGRVRGDGMGTNPYRTQSGMSSAHRDSAQVQQLREEIKRMELESQQERARLAEERRQEIARIEARHAAENVELNSKLDRLMKFVELNLPGGGLGDQIPQSQ
ncbi:hypothetical protein COLO4_33590, partial [Corchorus olitorius]